MHQQTNNHQERDMGDAENYAVRCLGFFLYIRRHRDKALFETPPKADKIKREQVKEEV